MPLNYRTFKKKMLLLTTVCYGITPTQFHQLPKLSALGYWRISDYFKWFYSQLFRFSSVSLK